MHCLTVASPLLILSVVASVKVCTNLSYLGGNVMMVPDDGLPLSPTDNSPLNHQEALFTTLDNSSLMLCARQCELISRCQSFIFNLTNGQCSLFSAIMMNTTNSSTSQDEVYADNIHSWPSRLAGDCENHTCPPNTVCEGNMSCLVTHCVNPPVIQNGLVTLTSPNQTFFDVGQVEYSCDNFYRPADILRCLSNGSWSMPSCLPITNCNQLKRCNDSYGDGEYWILLANRNLTRVKIYCKNMTSPPPIHFITLMEENYSESLDNCTPKCGRTTYAKIAINIRSLAVARTINTYFNGSCGIATFGTTASCAVNVSGSAACGQTGTFRIDLRGTGFTLNPNSSWKGNIDNTTPVVTHSETWDVVNMSCYARRQCKVCFPTVDINGDRSLQLDIDENVLPVEESAVIPTCSK